jgi:hypothetical protein
MPTTISYTISTPTLTGTEYFIVKYRLKSATSWTNVIPNPTNAPFTLSLADGDYVMAINTSMAPDDDPKLQCFTVNTQCVCPTFSNAQYHTGNIPSVSVDVNLPSGLPPCGLYVGIQDGFGVRTDIFITDLSQMTHVSGTTYTITAIVTRKGYEIKCYANCCGEVNADNDLFCEKFDVYAPDYNND